MRTTYIKWRIAREAVGRARIVELEAPAQHAETSRVWYCPKCDQTWRGAFDEPPGMCEPDEPGSKNRIHEPIAFS